MFIKGTEATPAILNWHFNGWAKYDDWHQDDAVSEIVGQRLGFKGLDPGLPRAACGA